MAEQVADCTCSQDLEPARADPAQVYSCTLEVLVAMVAKLEIDIARDLESRPALNIHSPASA